MREIKYFPDIFFYANVISKSTSLGNELFPFSKPYQRDTWFSEQNPMKSSISQTTHLPFKNKGSRNILAGFVLEQSSILYERH